MLSKTGAQNIVIGFVIVKILPSMVLLPFCKGRGFKQQNTIIQQFSNFFEVNGRFTIVYVLPRK